MGLFTALITLPLAPVRGTSWIAEQVLEQAEREYYDPATIQRQLAELEELRERGEIDEEEADDVERELIARLMRR